MTEEQFYHQQINQLRLEYEKAIKPYIDRLAYLKKIEPPKPICVTLEQTPPTQPQRKPWVSLTPTHQLMCWSRATHDADVEHKTEHQCLMDYGREIEAKLRELNEAANGIK